MVGTYNLHFQGSLSDDDRARLPEYSGVYERVNLTFTGIH